jgi:hypothetical protein
LDFGFPLSISINQHTNPPIHHAIFIYMLLLEKDKGAKPVNLPKDNALSEIGGEGIG